MKHLALPLLKNTDVRIHPRCTRSTPVWAAIQGPFDKSDVDGLVSYAIGIAIVAAVIVVCFDITVWRP